MECVLFFFLSFLNSPNSTPLFSITGFITRASKARRYPRDFLAERAESCPERTSWNVLFLFALAFLLVRAASIDKTPGKNENIPRSSVAKRNIFFFCFFSVRLGRQAGRDLSRCQYSFFFKKKKCQITSLTVFLSLLSKITTTSHTL